MFLITGSLASLIAWVLNRYLFLRVGEKSIILLTPIVEELLKSGLAITFGASLILTHILFGVIEAFLDYTNTGKITTACISLIWHAFLGAVTYLFFTLWGNIFIAIFIAMLIHFIWNKFVIVLANSKN